MAQNYYDILGVSKTADEKEIKKAYRKLAHQYHPDKKGGDEQKFKEINEAYQVLSDNQKRAQYDQFGSAYQQAGGSGQGFGGAQGFSFEDIFGQTGGFSFQGGFEDIFSDVFGGGRRNTSRRGKDIQVQVSLTLEEMYHGVKKTIPLNLQDECDNCHGSGSDNGKFVSCPQCKGSGSIDQQVRTMLGTFAQRQTCPTCKGKGEVPEKICHKCHGTGVEKKSKNIEVDIPAGIAEGQTLEVPNQGEAASFGGTKGSLYVTIIASADPRFIRKSDDLYQEIRIPYSLAVLGGSYEVDTITSKVTLKIPKHTQSGEVFRLRGRGMTKLHNRGHGDMLVTILIDIPKSVDRESQRIIKELQKHGL